MLTIERITQLQQALNAQGFFLDHEPNGEWTTSTHQAYVGWCLRNNVDSTLHNMQPWSEESIPEGLRDPELMAKAEAEAAERAAAAAEQQALAAAAADEAARVAAEQQAAAEAEAERLAAEAEAKRLAEQNGDKVEQPDNVIEPKDEDGDEDGEDGDEEEGDGGNDEGADA